MSGTDCLFAPSDGFQKSHMPPATIARQGETVRNANRGRYCGHATIRTAYMIGGDCEIRTHGRVAPSAVFKTAGLNHSPKSPVISPELADFKSLLQPHARQGGQRQNKSRKLNAGFAEFAAQIIPNSRRLTYDRH